MIFHKAANSLSATPPTPRLLSRYRPSTLLLAYFLLALLISYISYQVTFSIVLLPLASLSFSLLHRTPSSPPPYTLPDYPTNIISLANHTQTLTTSSTTQPINSHQINYHSLPMRRPEADMLLSYLSPNHVYLEYGASPTTLAISSIVRTAFSIENNPDVCNRIDTHLKQHPHLNSTLRAFCVPIRPGHAGWGTVSPFEEGSYTVFHNYVDLPLTTLSNQIFDRVLINGHARVACALRILPLLNKHSLVFFHDFFLRPAHYAQILPFYHEVARVVAHSPVSGYTAEPMGLLVLRPRRHYLHHPAQISISRINSMYTNYIEEQPTEATTRLEFAYNHGLLTPDKGGFPAIALIRKLARDATCVRLLLDLIALPFVILTYLVLRDVFRKLFLHALSPLGPRIRKLLQGDLRAAYTSTLPTSNPSTTYAQPKSMSSLPNAAARIPSLIGFPVNTAKAD